MTTATATPELRPAPPADGAAARGDAERGDPQAERRDSVALRLATFAALALFGTLHWAGLVAQPATGRALLVVLVACGGAAALVALRRLPSRSRHALAGAVAVATLLLGLMAAGLEARLLAPKNLAELFDGIDRGLAGVRTVDWPYDGRDGWVRLTILLGAPLLLALAAALAFWPARRRAGLLRASGLVTLLVLYGTAVTEHDPGQPALRGFGLLLLVAAWLWLPRLGRQEALAGAGAVLAVAVLAIPLSSQLDGERPWWDYRSFDWFGGGKVVSFDWRHSYGPLDWPRDGTTLLNVRSREPHYWKAETLDTFDGFRWIRFGSRTAIGAARQAYGELPPRPRPQGRTWEPFEYNPAWDERFRVTVRNLRSELVIGAGTTYRVAGAGTTNIASDGTTRKLSGSLSGGDTYEVRAYVPDPTPAQMRSAPGEYAPPLAQYTTIFLPRPGETATDGDLGDAARSARQPSAPVVMPLWGGSRSRAEQEGAILASPYARMYRLARRLTVGQPTSYDAARSVLTHLRRTYTYGERPPTRPHPLPGFLFEDRFGYCQQFSGAMALMLRMAGIPARVATGFTRGSFNRDNGEYRVRDLDAHSWVEVHFTGIGWVAFDPTPAATPAEGQAPGGGGGDPLDRGNPDQSGAAPVPDRATDAGANADAAGGPSALALALGIVAAAAAAAGAWLVLRTARARRDRVPAELAELQLAELTGALARLGWRLPAGITLLGLERRLARAGPASARYAAILRANRFDRGAPAAPAPALRRALRRELGSRSGVRGKLLALAAIPPGGPRER